MPGSSMVLVATVPTAFEAQLLAARLGAEGMLWQLRGNVGGPYPVGPVEILVAADDVGAARELLLADEVEALFDDDEGPAGWPADGHRGARRRGPVAVVAVALVAAFVCVRVLAEVVGWAGWGPTPRPADPVTPGMTSEGE